MQQDQSLRFPPKEFSAAIPKQNLTPHYCVRNLRLQAKFYISEAESMIHERNFVFWRNFKKRLIGTTNLRQQRCERDYPFSAEKFMGIARI
jgi:hypothetical protein